MRAQATADNMIRRKPQVPKPADGYAIVRVRKLEDAKTEGGIIVPMHTPGAPGFTDEPTQFYERYTVVETSGAWYAGSTRVEHPARPGDVVLMKPQSGYLAYDKDPRWPLDHRLIALQDVCAYYPCEMGEPMHKGDA